MQKVLHIVIIFLSGVYLASCSTDSVESKKEELESYKSEIKELQVKVNELEKELSEAGAMPTVEKAEILVATLPLQSVQFTHEVEMRGTVQSRRNVIVSAETMGRVEKVNVNEGQYVTAGQLLVTLDADILRNNISEVETSLELAEAVFTRQKNLWDQNIGTEIQYLQAKNNRDALQKRLATLRSQLRQYQVRAPFAGNVDDVIIKVGEMAQPGVPLIRVVNPNDMYILADVSEAYLGKFKMGDQANIYFPVQDKTFVSTISSVSRVINDKNRTFTIEVALPDGSDFSYQPNQVAVLNLTDYINDEAIVVPTRLIQVDDQGKYVYVAGKDQDRRVARKRRVATGLSYRSKTEILEGLAVGDQIIERGYRDVNEGTEIKLASL